MENFCELKGSTITKMSACRKGDEIIDFELSDGRKFKLEHQQDCCERVEVEDVCGNIEDLIGHPLLVAEEISSKNDTPSCVTLPETDYPPDSYTWTFYKLGTIKGTVTIRWFGRSNGYYSERVSFTQVGSES